MLISVTSGCSVSTTYSVFVLLADIIFFDSLSTLGCSVSTTHSVFVPLVNILYLLVVNNCSSAINDLDVHLVVFFNVCVSIPPYLLVLSLFFLQNSNVLLNHLDHGIPVW